MLLLILCPYHNNNTHSLVHYTELGLLLVVQCVVLVIQFNKVPQHWCAKLSGDRFLLPVKNAPIKEIANSSFYPNIDKRIGHACNLSVYKFQLKLQQILLGNC